MSKKNFLEKVFYIGRKVLSINPNTDEVETGEVSGYTSAYFGGVDGVIVNHGDGAYMHHDSFSITALNGDE